MKLLIPIILVLAFVALVLSESPEKSEDDFLRASERCMGRDNLSAEYREKFHKFVYPDEPKVHTFIHCVWTEMGLWKDVSGFDVEQIAALYKDRANEEVLVPILSNCNRNPHNYPPVKRCYTAFQCIMDSRVGQWFKQDVAQKVRENNV